MKYDNLRAFEKHVQSASPSHFSNLYVLIGKEGFDCKDAANTLLDAWLPSKKDREFSLRIFDADSFNYQDLLLELRSISFLAEKKVLWIQQAEKLKKSVLEELEKEIGSLYKSHYLILTAANLSRTSFYKQAEKIGIILDLPDVKPWEKEKRLVEWIAKQVSQERKIISHQACQYIVKYIGTEQQLLQQEIDKLVCYIGEKKEITISDIATLCANLNVETVWQLGEAVFRREARTALRIIKSILQEGAPFLPLLRQIRSQFQTEYHICTLLSRGASPEAITQEYPYMKGQILERHIQLARHYGADSFKKGLLSIDAVELQSKNSAIADELLAELLIIKLT